MREQISLWAKALEAQVVAERAGKRFSEVMKQNEYINTMGHDASILDVVLERGKEPFRINVYTRVVWSEEHPKNKPFAFMRYTYNPEPKKVAGTPVMKDGAYVIPIEIEDDFDREKPKQAFYDDKSLASECFSAEEIERRLGLAA
jgi:hypothetical protein